MTPSFAIFRVVYAAALGLYPEGVYDYLPDLSTEYPFIHIPQASHFKQINSDLVGSVPQQIDIYGTRRQRADVDKMAAKLHDTLIRLEDAYHYNISLADYTERVLLDTSTSQPLIHYVIEIIYRYTRKD